MIFYFWLLLYFLFIIVLLIVCMIFLFQWVDHVSLLFNDSFNWDFYFFLDYFCLQREKILEAKNLSWIYFRKKHTLLLSPLCAKGESRLRV